MDMDKVIQKLIWKSKKMTMANFEKLKLLGVVWQRDRHRHIEQQNKMGTSEIDTQIYSTDFYCKSKQWRSEILFCSTKWCWSNWRSMCRKRERERKEERKRQRNTSKEGTHNSYSLQKLN
jgi:hypothetical protein